MQYICKKIKCDINEVKATTFCTDKRPFKELCKPLDVE